MTTEPAQNQPPLLWKVSSYRPLAVIARDPKESTYEVGDDKFTPVLWCATVEESKRVVRCHNESIAALTARLALAERDSRRIDWLEKIATDGEDARSIEMNKIQHSNKINRLWSWAIAKIDPVGERLISLEWHSYSHEIRPGVDEEYGGHWDIRGVEKSSVRHAIDAAMQPEGGK